MTRAKDVDIESVLISTVAAKLASDSTFAALAHRFLATHPHTDASLAAWDNITGRTSFASLTRFEFEAAAYQAGMGSSFNTRRLRLFHDRGAGESARA